METNTNIPKRAYKPQVLKNSISEAILKMGGKLPPQALDVEEAVLGALLVDKEALISVVDILKKECFYPEKNQKIYNAILILFNNSEPVDLVTVVNQLRVNGDLEFIGGSFYLVTLTSKVVNSTNIEYHCRLLVQMAVKRELISLATELEKQAYDYGTDVFELLDSSSQKIFDISESNFKKSVSDVSGLLKVALEELEERSKLKDGLTGVPTGFSDLDRVTSGWQKSDLIIMAARPGMGKTAFVLSALRNAAVTFKNPVVIFSLEMSAGQMVNRLISSETEIESETIKKGNLSQIQWSHLHSKIRDLNAAPIFIDDTPGLSILELRAKSRRLVKQHDIKLIIIDYLQLMTTDASKSGPGNREQEISSISRSLKNLAKELNIPVIALSQLSRAVETRGGDKRPLLSDLRESGAIEQDADIVSFIYRPEYYKMDTYPTDGYPAKDTAEIIIAKHRNGSLGEVRLKFIGKFTKFADLDATPSGDFGSFANISNSKYFEDDPLSLPPQVKTFGSKMNDTPELPDTFDDFAPF